MHPNRHNNRRIKVAIYKLKRLYGGTIFLYRQGNPSTDLETGVKVWPGKSVIRIERAIVLPIKVAREQTQTISMISSDKSFVYGGFYDRGTRQFFIDPIDLPTDYVINQDDFIVYNGKQYEIKNIIDTEFNALWDIIGVELEGVVPQQLHELTVKHVLNVQQTSDGSV